MKKDKIKYSCLSGTIFIVLNIIAKFLIYGNDTIWMNYMPPLPQGTLPPEIKIFKYSIYKMIPFIIINICAISIYMREMYTKKIYNKKIDIVFAFIILLIVFIIMFFLIRTQYRICV